MFTARVDGKHAATVKSVMFRYSLFGQLVVSEIDLPGAPEVDVGLHETVGEEGLSIVCDPTLSRLSRTIREPSVSCQSAHISHIMLPKVGQVQLEGGRRVLVPPCEGESAAFLRAYLTGYVLGALMHQAKRIPLHMSAVEVSGKLVAFSGPSGAGKSTMATYLNRHFGFQLVSDDISVLASEVGSRTIHPGVRRVRLWRDAIDALNLTAFPKSKDVARFEKYHIDLSGEFTGAPRELHRLIILDRGSDFSLERLRGVEALSAVYSSIYRPELVGLLNDEALTFLRCAGLASEIEVYRLTRPWNGESVALSANLLVQSSAWPGSVKD